MTIEDILSHYDERVTALALATRTFLFNNLQDIIETPDAAANIIGYGYGPGYKQTICTIILSKKGVKLGFYKGSELPDPCKLLTGSGKVHKYVEIKTNDDLKHSALKILLKHALEAYKKRTA